MPDVERNIGLRVDSDWTKEQVLAVQFGHFACTLRLEFCRVEKVLVTLHKDATTLSQNNFACAFSDL